jgi:hypothetical protein
MRKWISRAGEGGVFGEPTNATQRFECGARSMALGEVVIRNLVERTSI